MRFLPIFGFDIKMLSRLERQILHNESSHSIPREKSDITIPFPGGMVIPRLWRRSSPEIRAC